jgi:hypothetical protein
LARLIVPKSAADIATDTAARFQYFPFMTRYFLSSSRGERDAPPQVASAIPVQKQCFNYFLLQQMRRFDSAVKPYRLGICGKRVFG